LHADIEKKSARNVANFTKPWGEERGDTDGEQKKQSKTAEHQLERKVEKK